MTYGTFYLDIEIEQWISEWNQSQEDYRIEIKEYEDSDVGRTQLNAEGGESRDDLVSGILEIYTQNHKLYGIPLGYRFETLLGKTELVGKASDWTTDKMIQMTQNLETDEYLLDGLAPLGLLRAVIATDMDSYVDWEKGECSFDGAKFRELLERPSKKS